jgi:hypothetical protein
VATVTGLALLAMTHAAWLAIAFAVLAGYLPVALLKARHGRRVRERREVWPDAIDHLVSAVRITGSRKKIRCATAGTGAAAETRLAAAPAIGPHDDRLVGFRPRG